MFSLYLRAVALTAALLPVLGRRHQSLSTRLWSARSSARKRPEPRAQA